MYRQLYQLGGSPTGIATMPMDYGQSLQVNNQGNGQGQLMSQAPNYSSAQSITSNPLLNYGQSPLGDAGGTPLTMRSGGISRLGYQEGGMGMVEDQAMMQPEQSQQQMMQPPLQGMEQPQADIKDPKQALEIIIQMLIAQGVPPEEAKKIALQMVQAVAEGGMNEMSDERIGVRFGGRIGYASGGIGNLVNREQYGFGSFISAPFKAAGKLVSGAVNAVKKVASSDIGKAALTIAAIYATGGGFSPGGFSMFGSAGSTAGGLLGSGGAFDLGSSYLGQGIFGTAGAPLGMGFGTPEGSLGLLGNLGITGGYGASLPFGITSLLPGKGTLLAGAAGALGGALTGGVPQQNPGESDADYQNRVNQYKLQYQQGVSNPTLSAGVNPTNLYPNNPFYAQRRANGGRIGYQEGGIGDLVKQTTQQAFFGTPMMAMGGRMGYAMGAEVPTRENQAGVKELDYRDTGGFVPPIGIKERADDIPAMLSNNEFVFTANAVRNAGGGDENVGAQRMYKLMKNLEAGGSV
jgi:hypothetical protein